MTLEEAKQLAAGYLEQADKFVLVAIGPTFPTGIKSTGFGNPADVIPVLEAVIRDYYSGAARPS